MRTTGRAPLAAVCLGLLLAAGAVAAETVYVTDRFEIGVHESTELDSIILAVIPSGTTLTVVAKEAGFVRVRTPDGVEGWVDARYVGPDKPSVALLDERDARLLEAARSLGDARAEVEVLRQRIAELQRDAATAAQNSSTAPERVTVASGADAAKLEEAERMLAGLTRENLQLKARVTDLQASVGALERSVSAAESEADAHSRSDVWRGPIREEGRSWTVWQWLLFGSILLLAFAAGGYAVDWESRRRHGGFRV